MNLKEIKDAARKAFRDQQLQDTEGGVPDAVSFCAGFLAGVRQEQENNSPNEALIKMLQDTIDSQKKQIDQLEEQSSWLVNRVDWDNLTREETDIMVMLYRKYFPDNF